GAHAPWVLEGQASRPRKNLLGRDRGRPSISGKFGDGPKPDWHYRRDGRDRQHARHRAVERAIHLKITRRSPVGGIVDAGAQHPTGITDPGYNKRPCSRRPMGDAHASHSEAATPKTK